ncbi:DUF1853 family protein [Neisseria sp. Ec49-e6-T10]|uniref:DUF1853 family protein n=1 Tax=Neisseria sp. Ec49-e6-T10 TaxID=3140744 RepID=UPI003EBA1743
MNYALDALWWKLTNQKVRDLASILTAPPLWHSGCELPVATLLGQTGFRYLLSLNEHPETLLNYLKDKEPFGYRLGLYAEHLLAFWFSHAPHCQLIAQNIAIECNKQTIGALDFIAQIGEQTYHIELTCKYYYDPTAEQTGGFFGLNRNDSLAQKATKLTQQLDLSAHKNTQTFYQQHHIDANTVKAASIIRGNAFTLSGTIKLNPPYINPHCWAGKVYDWASFMAQQTEQKKYVLIPRQDLLAPIRVLPEHITDFNSEQIKPETPIMIAQVSERYDGYFHEENRFIII